MRCEVRNLKSKTYAPYGVIKLLPLPLSICYVELVNQRRFICLGFLLCGMLPGIARADSFTLLNGTSLNGDVVSGNDAGIRLRTGNDSYSDVISWTNFSQADLKKFAQDPKLTQYATNFIEETDEQRIQKTEVTVTQPPRLKHPDPGSFFSALVSSSVGFFVLVILYAGGIYAGYEVALFRRRPKGLVCGLAAIPVLGFLSPIIFGAMPMHEEPFEEEEPLAEGQQPAPQHQFLVPGSPQAVAAQAAAVAQQQAAARKAAAEASGVPEPETPSQSGGLRLAQEQPKPDPAANLPKPQIYQRGAFMFNRRFFETKFGGFFGVVRRDAEKEMVLVIKSARGEYIADRISRISTNDFHVQVRKGHATEEVTIPFTEIQEVIYKHQNT